EESRKLVRACWALFGRYSFIPSRFASSSCLANLVSSSVNMGGRVICPFTGLRGVQSPIRHVKAYTARADSMVGYLEYSADLWGDASPGSHSDARKHEPGPNAGRRFLPARLRHG